jgi:ribosome-binding protein aMBF1 (putative translation factor)
VRPPARPSRPPPSSPSHAARASVAPPAPPAKSLPPPRPTLRVAPPRPAAPRPPPKAILRPPKRRARDEAEEAREDAFVAAFGENVRTARLARKLTQAALAVRARLSPNYVARLERGEVGASLWVAHCLAAAMAMKLAELLDRDRLLPPPPLLRR